MASPTFIEVGGNIVEVSGPNWTTVATVVYPGAELSGRGLTPSGIWYSADASSQGLEFVLQDNMGSTLAGPSTTFSGSGVFQTGKLVPFRAHGFRTSGPPQVLVLRARNKNPSVQEVSHVGQAIIELRD